MDTACGGAHPSPYSRELSHSPASALVGVSRGSLNLPHMTAGMVTACVLGKPPEQDPAGGPVPTESLSLFRAERNLDFSSSGSASLISTVA